MDDVNRIIKSDCRSNAWLINSTLNGLANLIHHRASTANKILLSILNYNPYTAFKVSYDPKSKVMVKSVERTIRALLLNVMKK